MTSPVNAWIGPLGPVTAMAAGTLYTMVKDVGTDIQLRQEQGVPVDTLPDEFRDMVSNTEAREREIHGLFYTHTRFKPILRKLGLLHNYGSGQSSGGEAAANLNKSHSVGVKMPWRMTYTEVTLDIHAIRLSLLKNLEGVNQKNSSSFQSLRLKLEDIKAKIAQAEHLAQSAEKALARGRSARQADLTRVRDENRVMIRDLRVDALDIQNQLLGRESYLALQERAETTIGQLVGRKFMKNFRMEFTDSIGTVRAGSSTGIKGRGLIKVTSIKSPTYDSHIAVHFEWHEDHFLGKGHNWFGDIHIKYGLDSEPSFTGSGPFWDRFQQFQLTI